jgi:hypothetical protein
MMRARFTPYYLMSPTYYDLPGGYWDLMSSYYGNYVEIEI